MPRDKGGARLAAARELRFAFTFNDYNTAVRLFRDVFGLELLEDFSDETGRGILLRVPSATLEVFDRGYAATVDRIEVGKRVGGQVRVAVRTEDLHQATRDVQAAGAVPMADPVRAPWGDYSQRFQVDYGLQLTLFQQD